LTHEEWLIIAEALPWSGEDRIEDIAARLGMDARALQRILDEMGIQLPGKSGGILCGLEEVEK